MSKKEKVGKREGAALITIGPEKRNVRKKNNKDNKRKKDGGGLNKISSASSEENGKTN